MSAQSPSAGMAPLPALPDELGRFFGSMGAFLRGETDVTSLSERLGSSPSGSARLGYYRVLMQRNLELILGDLFPSVRTLVRRPSHEAWASLVADYGRAHPPRDWQPNGFGKAFADYLEERGQRDGTLPGYLAELADYHYCLYSVGVAPGSADAACEFETTLFLRHYDHDVLEFMRRLKSDPDAQPPLRRATAVVIYREPKTATPRAFRPSREELLLLVEHTGRRLDLKAANVPSDDLSQARQRLRDRGILAQAGS